MGEPNREVNMKMGWAGEVFYIIEISKKPTSQVSKGEKGKGQVMQHSRRSDFRVFKTRVGYAFT